MSVMLSLFGDSELISCPQIRGLTGAGVVEVGMYICIANNKVILKFTLVDRFSFPASNVSHFQRNKLYIKKKKRKGGKRTAGPFKRRSSQTDLFSSPGNSGRGRVHAGGSDSSSSM